MFNCSDMYISCKKPFRASLSCGELHTTGEGFQEDSYLKGTEMLVIPLRDVKYGFWYHSGRSGRNCNICTDMYQYKVSFTVASKDI